MQAAEGKGPKQIKKPYVLGQFVTNYGNDGTPGTVNPPNPPYTAVVGATSTISGGARWAGGMVGSNVPGLNLNVNGNGATDVGYVCAPEPNVSLQDMETLFADLWLTSTFSGTAFFQLQGSNNRFYQNTVYNSNAWVTIASGTITTSSGNTNLTLNNIVTAVENPKLAYRLTASGSGVGIIDWSIPGMYIDLNAMGNGNNAIDANGNIGQMSIQNVRNLSIISGTVVSGYQAITVTSGSTPYSNINGNRTFLGN